MRIVGGNLKGLHLKGKLADCTRPTTEEFREALFNILNSRFAEHEMSHVLDLFAGSGALSFEALSRGAERAVLVENNLQAIAAIGESAKVFDLGSKIRILKEDYFKKWGAGLGKIIGQNQAFDTVFCDPPYGKNLFERMEKELFSKHHALFTDDCLLICELEGTGENPLLSHFDLQYERKKGKTKILFYLKKG